MIDAEYPAEPEEIQLLRAVPEFRERYLALIESADGDPGSAAALAELAELAAELALGADTSGAVLGRLMEGVEQLCARSPDAEDLVAGAFLEALSPDDLRRLGQWMGPATRAALDDLELPPEAWQGGASGEGASPGSATT